MVKVGVFVGSEFGTAERVATHLAHQLALIGWQVQLYSQPEYEVLLRYHQDVVVIVTSTTGQGEQPKAIAPLYEQLRELGGYLGHCHYAVVGLGDSRYPDFCQAGRHWQQLLAEYGGQPLLPMLEIDASETLDSLVPCKAWLKQFSRQLNTQLTV
ncbi:hypothetical protein VST7929_02154 [Vibrio stylophorae]|uniref:Flavodoxin-like domain-containing protein n=1 Tax=Vibrio stylophorae TaxID=659351 RepID=A0ABM8ZVA9_9VIBR|nr:flavodoxin domain-containing protein [Vibrio stylophorae]CAH0534240.1 hypothetical protein VST7929_02154 [Vibrio stylophorae]